MEGLSCKKRVRDESAESDLPEMKKIRDDLLGFFDDSDPDTAVLDLDSVMKSFENEISPTFSSRSVPVPVVDLTSDSGDSQQELGFLLEASDDELGLPPSANSSAAVVGAEEGKSEEAAAELVRVDSGDSTEIGELWGFEEQIPNYEAFGFDDVVGGGNFNGNGEYVVGYDDGLFEYSNVCFDSSEFSDFSWRVETTSG